MGLNIKTYNKLETLRLAADELLLKVVVIMTHEYGNEKHRVAPKPYQGQLFINGILQMLLETQTRDLLQKGISMDTENTNLLSVSQISQVYSLSKYALYTLIKTDPAFPCINIGPKKNYRIPSDQFNAWLHEKLKERQYSEFNVLRAADLYNVGRS